MKPLISLVVPTYQRRASIERLLKAIDRQTLSSDFFEVIVVIDGSEDGTRELVESASPAYALRSIWQTNQGRARACNTGIRRAQGEIVVLLDDDMEPAPGFLEAHCQAHRFEPSRGVIGAAPIEANPDSPSIVRYMARKFNTHLQRLSQPDNPLEVRDFYSGNFSTSKEILFEVGLFNERYTVYGNEDLDLFVRLRQAGVQVIYYPQALAYQHYEKDFPTLAHDEISKGRTAVMFAHQHPEAYPESKIGTYNEGSRLIRLARFGLLGLSSLWQGAPELVIRGVAWIERRQFKRMSAVYRFTLDYFFWLGVRDGQNHPILR
jgi:GT2 family glycosyltransferase